MDIRTVLIILLTYLSQSATADNGKDKLKEFETAAWQLRSDLIHNHTYELANIKKADSLYKKSVEMSSIYGKLYALQIRTYALAGNDRTEEFLKTVNEYIKLALDNKLYNEYFDAASAKTQYLIGLHEYTKSLFEAKDMVATAEKVHNLNGIYESNLLLGQIHKYRNSWLMADKHLRKSLDAVRKVGKNDSIPYCLIYREMSECHSGMGKHAQAIEYARKAKQWANYDIYRYFSEWTYFIALYNNGDMKLFRDEYQKSPLRQRETMEMLPEEMRQSLDIMVNVANGNYDQARRLQKLLSQDKDNSNYDMLAGIYYHEGNYKKAYEHLLLQQLRTDSIENLLQQDELSEMEARLGTATLRMENREAKLRQRQILMASIGALLVFIICTILYMLRRRHKQAKALAEINKAIEQKNIELTEAQAITEQALIKAEQANAMRSHFIENMMHEIRTPLNAISGFTQLLTDPNIPIEGDMATEMREIIMTNTDNLTTMLNQIIQLSSFDSGSEKINIEETSLEAIVRKAVDQYGSSVQEGVELIVQTEEATITTDCNLAAQALGVLIHNAGKYTAEGSITIESVASNQDIRISVTDTGIGVEDEKAEKIFERFYKVDEFIPGTGLGLSLCRAIITTLGGTVFLDKTNTTSGCRFIISLPR